MATAPDLDSLNDAGDHRTGLDQERSGGQVDPEPPDRDADERREPIRYSRRLDGCCSIVEVMTDSLLTPR
jgi:hypothetical protein